MNKQIAITCIVDSLKGFGNFNRCLVLAESFHKKGYKVFFIIHNNSIAIKTIREKKFDYVLIPKSFSYKNEYSFIIKILERKNCNAIIIDVREYGEKLSQKLMGKNLKTILIDDAWCRKAYADLIFNVTPIKKFHSYKKINKNVKLYLGSKYFITNPQFRKFKKTTKILQKKKYNIVVSMGGSDPHKLSFLVVKSLQHISNINTKLVIGPFFKHTLKFKNFIKKQKNITIIYSPISIWKIFQNSDIVISSASSTLFELAIQMVPTLCIATEEHQIPYAKLFASKKFVINLGFWKNLESRTIQKTLVNILNDKNLRKKMSRKGQKLVDGRGVGRITKIILNILEKSN